MTRRGFSLVVLAGVVAAVAFAASASSQPQFVAPPKAVDNWEYGSLQVYGQPIWTSGDEELLGGDWKGLAEKLKAPVKGDGKNPDRVRVAVFNHLGSRGWELVSHATHGSQGSYSTYTFKRRVP